jgi:ubiquinone/menaquinone biosynthesis C-methylase UbiE
MHKFESPARLAELAPADTLRNIGLIEDSVFCDIGSGTGIFTVEAAKITKNTIYAIDTSDEMLRITKDKCKRLGLSNVRLIHPKGFSYPIEDAQCDVVLLSTVFHEIDDKAALLREIHRILAPQGKLAIIEFYKKETPMGPPVDHRIGEKELHETVEQYDFLLASQSSLGENLYLAVFMK